MTNERFGDDGIDSLVLDEPIDGSQRWPVAEEDETDDKGESKPLLRTKTIGTKITRSMLKAAHKAQHERVDRDVAKAMAKFFKQCTRETITKLFAKDWTPDPEAPKAQAERLMDKAFNQKKWDAKLVESAGQPITDAFLEGAIAEVGLNNSAKRRKAAMPTKDADDFDDEYGDDIDFPTELPDWLREAAQDYIIQTFEQDYWTTINETTRNDIELTLYRAIEEGRSIREIRDEIRESHGGAYSRARATNVARTETTASMSAGAVESIRKAYEDTGLEPAKEWLSVLSNTTRPDHADADGQQVPLDDDFTVGGERCAHPGDYRLSAAQRCNCMCAVLSALVGEGIYDDDGEIEERGYNPDQPRDESGRWSSGGAADTGSSVVTQEEEAGLASARRSLTGVLDNYREYAQARERAGGTEDWDKHYGVRLKNAKHLDELVTKIKRQQGAVTGQLTKWQKKANELADLEAEANRLRAGDEPWKAVDVERRMMELAPAVDKAYEAYQKLSKDKMDKMIGTVREHIKTRLAENLDVPAPVKLNVSGPEGAPADEAFKAKVGPQVSQAQLMLEGCVTGKIDSRYTKPDVLPCNQSFHGGNRAYFSDQSGVHVPTGGTDYQTVIHEYGHSLERDGEVSTACQSFLWHRTEGEEPVSLKEKFPDSGYDLWEVGREDKFREAFSGMSAYYVGKYYTNYGHGNRASEVLSMGMEKLFYNPREFADKDPEYFKFVVGVLDGTLL